MNTNLYYWSYQNGRNAAVNVGEDNIKYAAWNGEEMYARFNSYKKPYLNRYE